ncbi:MAG: hypothetical protein ISR64_06135 [Deltaproteobacteria bacterium]|nr:hypothetical protein [Deltaproteobacteria bacterium]
MRVPVAVLLWLVMATMALPSALWAKGKPLWKFKAMMGEKVTGRFDFGVVHRDEKVFVVSAFYAGEKALQPPEKKKKLKPVRRAYGELTEQGTLGRYKRWDIRDQVERYWMTFVYKGKVKVRYEKGPGAKGEVEEMGEREAVVPLDGGQPQFAYLLADAGESGREVACVGVSPPTWGKATVVFSGPDEVTLTGTPEEKRKVDRWDILGDCGQFKVYLDATKEPVLITMGEVRYERIATDPK